MFFIVFSLFLRSDALFPVMPRKKLTAEERLIRNLPPQERDRARALDPCDPDSISECRLRRIYQISCSLNTQTGIKLSVVLDRLKALAPATRHCLESRREYSDQRREQRRLNKIIKTCLSIVKLFNERDSPYCEICQVKINSSATSAAVSPAAAGDSNAPAPSPPTSPASPQPGPSSAAN